MRDLTSKRLIVAKGLLFLVIALVTAALILFEHPSVRVAALLALLVWSSCRLYYFLCYVLENYVDPTLKYAGLFAVGRALRASRRAGTTVVPCDDSVRTE